MLFLSLISVTVISRWVMNLFPQLWAQLCLEEESFTCLASFPMVSEWKIVCFIAFEMRAADKTWICFQHSTL